MRPRVVPTPRYSVITLGSTAAKEDDIDELEQQERDKNATYLRMLLFGAIPHRASSLDCSRMMILMFCVNSLEMLGRPLSRPESEKVIEWIYSRQSLRGGFDGGSDVATPAINGHLAMTYSALIALVTLGDDLSRVNKERLHSWIRSLQETDGSMRAVAFGSEADARFIYSAAASCFLLQDWTGLDCDLATQFILDCWNVSDGGFGLRPTQESHGGATYTCLAALSLMGKFSKLSETQRQNLIHFCINKQIAGPGGFNGRVNKACDTCYAYWIVGSLQILGYDAFVDRMALNMFLDTTFSSFVGGFSKTQNESPDPYHTHFGICARAFGRSNASEIIDANLGISVRSLRSYVRGTERTLVLASGEPYKLGSSVDTGNT